MRIAYLCADFGIPIRGRKGASIHVRELVRALGDEGCEIDVFAPVLDAEDVPATAHAMAEAPEPDGVSFVQILQDPNHVGWIKGLRGVEEGIGMRSRLRAELRNILYNDAFLAQVHDRLAARRPDLVYERYTLFGHTGGRLARELGVPHVLEVNAPLADEVEKARGLELRALAHDSERRILCGAGAVIVVSEELRSHARSLGVPDDRIHVVPNGVDPRAFAVRPDRDAIGPHRRERLRGKHVVGFVGSLKPWHGVEVLVEAFRLLRPRCPEAHLLLVGDGPQRESLEQLAERHGLSDAVTFAGAVPYEDVPQWIAAMDIATAPYTAQEDFYFSPIKVFEYLAMERPVVAGAIGQIAQLLAGGEMASLFEPGRADQLAGALEDLIRDPGRARRMGASGAAWVRRERTWEINARRVLEIAAALKGDAPHETPVAVPVNGGAPR